MRSSSSRHGNLILVIRVCTLVSLFISIVIMLITKGKKSYGQHQVKFNDVKALVYVLSAAVIGFVYSVIQSVLWLLPSVDPPLVSPLYIFKGDLAIGFLLLSAGSAGAAVILQVRDDYRQTHGDDDIYGVYKFCRYASASISFELIAFTLLTVSSLLFAKKAFQTSKLSPSSNANPTETHHDDDASVGNDSPH